MTIEATLEERGSRYGAFTEHARITQNIKRAMADSPNWDTLKDDQRECLEMVAHKVGRILNGDPDYHDSWHDVNGYVKLVADLLTRVVPCEHTHWATYVSWKKHQCIDCGLEKPLYELEIQHQR